MSIQEDITKFHEASEFLHNVATGPATGNGSTVFSGNLEFTNQDQVISGRKTHTNDILISHDPVDPNAVLPQRMLDMRYSRPPMPKHLRWHAFDISVSALAGTSDLETAPLMGLAGDLIVPTISDTPQVNPDGITCGANSGTIEWGNVALDNTRAYCFSILFKPITTTDGTFSIGEIRLRRRTVGNKYYLFEDGNSIAFDTGMSVSADKWYAMAFCFDPTLSQVRYAMKRDYGVSVEGSYNKGVLDTSRRGLTLGASSGARGVQTYREFSIGYGQAGLAELNEEARRLINTI